LGYPVQEGLTTLASSTTVMVCLKVVVETTQQRNHKLGSCDHMAPRSPCDSLNSLRAGRWGVVVRRRGSSRRM